MQDGCAGMQFTCFTGTKVQILTADELRAAAHLYQVSRQAKCARRVPPRITYVCVCVRVRVRVCVCVHIYLNIDKFS